MRNIYTERSLCILFIFWKFYHVLCVYFVCTFNEEFYLISLCIYLNFFCQMLLVQFSNIDLYVEKINWLKKMENFQQVKKSTKYIYLLLLESCYTYIILTYNPIMHLQDYFMYFYSKCIILHLFRFVQLNSYFCEHKFFFILKKIR